MEKAAVYYSKAVFPAYLRKRKPVAAGDYFIPLFSGFISSRFQKYCGYKWLWKMLGR